MTTKQRLDIRAYINERGMSGYQWLMLGLCFLIVATDGMDVAIMGFLAPDITREWGISKASFGVVMSAAPIGLAVGALLVGPLSDRFGRKKLLVASIALFGLFNLASAFAGNTVALSLLRFLTGLGLGAAMPSTTNRVCGGAFVVTAVAIGCPVRSSRSSASSSRFSTMPHTTSPTCTR